MTGRKLSDFVHDLDLYCRIATILEQGPASLRDIAERLNISSASIVSTCIKRIEVEYGKTLVSITSTSGYNTLTPDGTQVYRDGQEVIHRINTVRQGKPRTTLRIAASHMLLVFVLPEFVRRFLGSATGRGVNIEFNDACEYEQTLHLVNSGALDFALTWDFVSRDRQAESYEFLKYDLFANKFDVVAICHPDHAFARKYRDSKSVRIEDLATERIFVLHGHHQPFLEILPIPREGGNRMELEDYSSIISNVRMGLEGVALVPGVYRELDYYQKLGNLVHIPISHGGNLLSMGVAGVYKTDKKGGDTPTMSRRALKLYGMIRSHFNDPSTKVPPGWRRKDKIPAILSDRSHFDIARYGQAHLMVLVSRGGVKLPEWRRAKIEWSRGGSNAKRTGTMTIVDSLVDTNLAKSYSLSAGRLTENFHYLTAEPKGQLADRPTMAFAFHMEMGARAADREEVRAVFGFCFGAANDKPVIGVAVLSPLGPDADPLPHHVVASIARLGMLRVSTNHVDRPPLEEIEED